MKLPRDMSGRALAHALARFGYRVTRQVGSHMRLTTMVPAVHHITVPAHRTLKVSTIEGIVAEVALRQNMDRARLETELFG